MTSESNFRVGFYSYYKIQKKEQYFGDNLIGILQSNYY